MAGYYGSATAGNYLDQDEDDPELLIRFARSGPVRAAGQDEIQAACALPVSMRIGLTAEIVRSPGAQTAS